MNWLVNIYHCLSNTLSLTCKKRDVKEFQFQQKNTTEAHSFKFCGNFLDVKHGGIGNDALNGCNLQLVQLPFICEETITSI